MKVYNLLIGRGHWTKHAFGRLKPYDPRASERPNGNMEVGLACSALSTGVSCWCLSGAVEYCYLTPREIREVHQKLAESIRELFPERYVNMLSPREIVIEFNDSRLTTKGDVLAVAEHAGV